MKKKRNIKTKDIVELSLFSTIIVVLGLTPVGFIPTGIFNIAIVHIPVIIGSIISGYKRGAFWGLIFGLTSLLNNTIRPGIMSLFFSPFISQNLNSLIVCLVPRILTGIVPCFVFKMFRKRKKIGAIFAGALGALTNTFFVMVFIYLFFKEEYLNIMNISAASFYIILSSVALNALIEALSSAIITLLICNVFVKIKRY